MHYWGHMHCKNGLRFVVSQSIRKSGFLREAGGIVRNLRAGNFDAYETMREFWIKVLNCISSMLVKDIFEQIRNFYYWRGSVALMDPPCFYLLMRSKRLHLLDLRLGATVKLPQNRNGNVNKEITLRLACFLSKAQNPGLASERRANYHFPYSCLAVRAICILTTRGTRHTNISNSRGGISVPYVENDLRPQ